MFYFDSLEKLRDFDSFRVEAVNVFHDKKETGPTPAWYSVIGQIRPDIQFQYSEFPAADFPHERHATLFAELCEHYLNS
jgi:hypothetical protein